MAQAFFPGFLRDGEELRGRVTGPLSGESLAAVEASLHSAARQRFRVLTLDLEDAEYLDSDGIRWLQRIHSQLAEQQVELRLAVREKSRVERTLALLQLDATFRIERRPAALVRMPSNRG